MRLIDADALIPMMKYATTDSEIGVFPIKIGFDAIVKVINAQSTIERKKGRWGNAWEYPWDKCSVCGHCVNPYEDDYFFCPNCGADMRGDEHALD